MPARKVNWDDIHDEPGEREGYADEYWKSASEALGTRQLGISRVRVPAGKMACPEHEHSREEELYVVLEGSGDLIEDDKRTPLRAGDVVSCLPAAGSHGIEAGADGIEYLVVSHNVPGDWCWYPASRKVLVEGLYLRTVDDFVGNYYFRDPRAGRFGGDRDRPE